MKVTYEFDLDDLEKNDKYELQLVQNAQVMYRALSDIRDYMRQIYKGWIEFDEDKIMDLQDQISEYITDSKIYEIE